MKITFDNKFDKLNQLGVNDSIYFVESRFFGEEKILKSQKTKILNEEKDENLPSGMGRGRLQNG